MLIVAAVCPHPPLLVPEVAQGAATELDLIRAACDEAVGRLRVVPRIIVVGTGPRTHSHPPDATGSLRPYGVNLSTGPDGELPLSLTIGRWLLERAGLAAAGYQEVAADAATADCLRLGAELVAGEPTALLVMGDGSACLTEKAPGGFDERARPFDDEVARALHTADRAAIAALDAAPAADLMAAGRAAWQVLAGAADDTCHGTLHARDDRYGVGYHVANWARASN